MKNVIFLSALIIFSAATALAQIKSDLQSEGLKGAVKTIESYEVSFWGAENDRRQGKRNITGITEFDRTGNILERLYFSNDGAGSYYEKYVHFYDSKGRKSSIAKYVSTKNKPDVTFEAEKTPNWFYSLMLRLKESLSTRTLFKFDENDRLTERTEIDAAGNIVERRVFDYDPAGKLARFAIYNAQDELKIENLTDHPKGAATIESVRMENGVEVSRFIQHFDAQRRVVKAEQFALKPAPDASEAAKFVIHSSKTYKYEDGKVKMEWTIFDERGNPRSKQVIHDLNDDASLYESFEYRNPSGDDPNRNADSGWRLNGREFSNYEYDKTGNWLKITRFRQENPSRPPFPSSIRERTISYY